MKLLLISISLFFTTTALADCCICTTDTSPKHHIKWYKTGCRMWLTARGCPLGKIISHDEDIEKHIPKSCEGKKLKLGYVGHWASSRDTVDYLTSIMGVLNKKNLSLQYDNTACLAMSNPNEVQSYLNDISPHLGKRKIIVKGNQAISTGMWDPILPGKHNFKAVASTEAERVMFPKCRKLVNKSCWGRFQAGETGICIEKDGTKSFLKCSRKARSKLNVFRFLLSKRNRKTKTVWQRIPMEAQDFESEFIEGNAWYMVSRYNLIKSSSEDQKIIFPKTDNFDLKTREQANQYISDIKKLNPSLTEEQKRKLQVRVIGTETGHYIHNQKLGFKKRFNTKEEADTYVKEIKSYDKKQLKDLIFNDFLSRK